MFNRWFSYRINRISFVITFSYWLIACVMLQDIFLIGFSEIFDQKIIYPEWMFYFFLPGMSFGLFAAYLGGQFTAVLAQLFLLYVLVLFVRIIVIFVFAVFGWEEE